MNDEADLKPENLARGKWLGLVKAVALLGVAVFVFLITKDPGGPSAGDPFSEIGRWKEVEERGEIEWKADGREILYEKGQKVDERDYRVVALTAESLVVEREFSPDELVAHPEWKGRGRVIYRILGSNRLRRDFTPESGVEAMEFVRDGL
jgi:hypothetical protein